MKPLEQIKAKKPAPPPRSGPCLNCGGHVSTPFCAHCGQENEPLRLGIGDILKDSMEEFLRLDAKFFVTIVPLLIRPGFLTKEWAAGRRQRYISPMKLYLTCTFLFFLLAFSRLNGIVQTDTSGPEETFVEKPVTGTPVQQFFERGAQRLEHLKKSDAIESIGENLPTALFVMLPLFALGLKVFYVRSNRFYAEHLVFALHVHSFFFVILTLFAYVPIGRQISLLLCAVYTVWAVSSYYGQGILKTFVKTGMLGCAYSILLTCAIFGALFFGLASKPINAKTPAVGGGGKAQSPAR